MLAMLKMLLALPVVQAHSSCCEEGGHHHHHHHEDQGFLSIIRDEVEEACPWLVAGLLVAMVLQLLHSVGGSGLLGFESWIARQESKLVVCAAGAMFGLV